MTDRPDGRDWVVKCQWKGAAKPFWFGTLHVRLGAPHHEIEAAVQRALDPILPADLIRPDIIELVPGSLIFLAEVGA